MNEFIGEIEEIGFGGEGVCHNNGKICFVKYCLPGEKLLIEKIEEKTKFDFGKIKKLLVKSPERTMPLCPYFGVCGGCDFQHTTYSNELAIKKAILNKQLTRYGYNFDFSVIGSDKEYFYRNKIRLFAGQNGLGFKEEKTNQIVEICECKIADKLINECLPILNEFIYNQKLQLFLNYVEIKTQQEKLLINLYLKKKVKYDISILKNRINCEFGLFETFSDQTKHVFGINNITLKDNRLNYIVSSNSFIQINNFIAKKIYNKVTEIVKGKTVANCYSGAGLLSGLICLNGASKVYGIELGKSEHEDAENLKFNNKIENLYNKNGDCAVLLPLICEKIDLIIVDPPRKGCAKEVCQILNKSIAKEIIYISCNHATFVRDLNLLNNYKIKDIELFDMFPRTANFEIFSILEKT